MKDQHAELGINDESKNERVSAVPRPVSAKLLASGAFILPSALMMLEKLKAQNGY